MNQGERYFDKCSTSSEAQFVSQLSILNRHVLESALIDAEKVKKFYPRSKPLPICASCSDRPRDLDAEEDQRKQIYDRSTWQMYNRIVMFRKNHVNLCAKTSFRFDNSKNVRNNIERNLLHPDASTMIPRCEVHSSIEDDEENNIFYFEM